MRLKNMQLSLNVWLTKQISTSQSFKLNVFGLCYARNTFTMEQKCKTQPAMTKQLPMTAAPYPGLPRISLCRSAVCPHRQGCN